MRLNHRIPRNHEDFEILCLRLLRAYWKCEQLERYSTPGGAQHGIDIIDLSGQDPLRAAQCKLHEESIPITAREVLAEVEKAKAFTPPLGLYLILTTAKGNKEIHDAIIKINRNHRENGLFEVQFMAWNRIEELLDQYTDIRDQYEGGLSAMVAARLDTRLGNIEIQLADRTADERADQFHSEIDEARDCVNKGELQLAKLLLQRLRTRHEAELNARHRFRILTNLAAVAIGEDDWKKAGELYLEAKAHQPDDEMAQINEALGYQILGEPSRAFETASALKALYPHSERLFGILVRNAPDQLSFTAVEAEIPPHIALKGEAAVSLGQRARDNGDFVSAEKYFRAATTSNPSWYIPWLLLGSLIVDDETTQSWKMYGFAQVKCNTTRLAEAEASLTKAVSLARTEGSKQRTAEALSYLSRARVLLGKEEQGYKDIEEAARIAPEDPEVVTCHGQILSIRGNTKAAIEVMRRLPATQLPPHGQMLLVVLLMERGSASDRNEAANICLDLAKAPDQMKPDFRENVIEVGLDLLTKLSRHTECVDMLEALPTDCVSEIARKTLRSKCSWLGGEQERATSEAREALDLVTVATSAHDIRRLAMLLSAMGRHKDALPLWQRVTIPSVASGDTRGLLECASRLGRHDIMLETFQALRAAGASSPEFLEHELQLLELYDTPAAIDVMQREVSNTGNKLLRLRLSYLGVALDRDDLIDKDAANIPTPNEIPTQMGVSAVQVLRVSGHPMEAVEYAYHLLRRHFDDINAHRAMLAALAPYDPDPDISKPEQVEPGTAVSYVEDGNSSQHWIVLEDSPQVDSKLGERDPSDQLCKQMIGKKVGDQFTLAEGVQNRTGKIVQIVNKYVYRYQDCMTQWQIRFPGSRDVQMVKITSTVDESGQTQPDLSAIEKSVEEREDHVKNIEQIYQTQNVSIHIVAKHFGANTFEGLQHLATRLNVTVKCCFGSAEERNEASKALANANTIVLDMSAIATLFMLRRLEVLENWPIDLVISQATDNELRQMIANESRTKSREAGILMKTQRGLGLIPHDADQAKTYLAELRQLVEILEKKCKVLPCRALAALEADKRSTLVEAFGNHGAEAILLACVPGWVLWTDDLIQALIARNDHGVRRVWTQLVLGDRADRGTIAAETFLDASAKLVGLGYFFTSVSPTVLRQAAVIAEWNMAKWPLTQALEKFEQQSIDLPVAMQLAAGFLKLLYMESLLPETQTAVTMRVLEHIAKRKNGLMAIHALRKALPRIFGLNVVGLMAASQTIDLWLRSR